MNLKKNILSVIALTFVLTINSNAYEAVTIPMPKIYKGIKIIPNNNIDFPPASYSITKHYSYEVYRVGKRDMLQPITFVDARYSIQPGSRLKDLDPEINLPPSEFRWILAVRLEPAVNKGWQGDTILFITSDQIAYDGRILKAMLVGPTSIHSYYTLNYEFLTNEMNDNIFKDPAIYTEK